MALALSRSLQSEDSSDDVKASGQKNMVVVNLEQFVYKPSTSKYSVSNHRLFVERRKTNARLKYVKPILMMRTEEKRNEIIATNISELLLNNVLPMHRPHKLQSLKPISKSLHDYYYSNQSLFKKSNYECDAALDDFYVKQLNLDQSTNKCGSLLKDWSKMPGRSVSPVVNFPDDSLSCLSVSTPTEVCDSNHVTNNNVQIFNSPELFDSDDDNLYITTRKFHTDWNSGDCNSKENSDSSSESLLNLTPKNSIIQTSNKSVEKDHFHLTSAVADVKNNKDIPETSVSDMENRKIESKKNQKLYVNSVEDDCYDLTLSSSSEDSIKNTKGVNLKLGISDNFRDGLNLDDPDGELLEDSVAPLKHVNNFRNKTVHCLKDTFDELFENEVNLSIFTENVRTNDSSKMSSNRNIETFTHSFSSTQDSIIISDDEVNYSCNYGKSDNCFESGLSSLTSSLESINSEYNSKSESKENSPCSTGTENTDKNVIGVDAMNDTILYTLKEISNSDDEKSYPITNANENTPKSEVLIKTSNVTPSTDYSEMNTPKIEKELEKFGIKPLKRKHGIKLLNYIYEFTHPMLHHTDINPKEGLNRSIIKRRKINEKCVSSTLEHVSDEDETNAAKHSYNVLGENEELIFEKTQSKRIASCRIPLHIVWYNLVASDPNLQKSILLYEPLQLEFLYKTIKNNGYKFHIQDLLKFLDKKCITIRTEQQSRYKRKNCKRKSE